MAETTTTDSRSIDPRSGYSASNSTFYSKRPPLALPTNPALDITTFISSCSHCATTAFIDAPTGRRISFTEVWSSVESLASALSSPLFNLRKGHVVLILSPNSVLFPIVCLAAMSLGSIVTTTNPLNTKSEIAKQIADSKPILAFSTSDLLPKLADSNFPIILLDDVTDDVAIRNQNSRVSASVSDLMRKPPSPTRIRDRVTVDDPAMLLYSSGTTGASKGVMSTHGNLIAMVQVIVARCGADDAAAREEHVYICTVPMFHVYGLATLATGMLAVGATVVVLPRFEPHDLFTAIERFRVTDFPLVPPIIVAMTNNAEALKKRYDLSSLESVFSGGAPLGREVIEGFVEKFPGISIQQGYGLTETVSVGSSTYSMEESRKYGTAGLLSPGIEAKVVDPVTGKELAVNETGELWLRGPTVMKGYFNNPEATASTLDSNGWLRTGDICYIDEDGHVFVVDRLKELIKYKGYQVAPAELEALLLAHPEIEDAAVIPYPDKEVGQFPMAYVVRKASSTLSKSAIMDFVTKQVAPYKRVRKVAFIASVPKNASGKILRKDLISMTTSKL